MTKARLTARQKQVFDYLVDYFKRNDQLPPAEAIRAHFGWAGHNAAVEHMQRLERKGYIERNETGNKYRFCREAVNA